MLHISRFYAGMFYHFHPTRTARMIRTIYTIHKSFAYQTNTRNLTHVGMRMPSPTAELRHKASSSEGGMFLSVITNHGTRPDSTTSAVQRRRRISSNFTAYYSRTRNLIYLSMISYLSQKQNNKNNNPVNKNKHV